LRISGSKREMMDGAARQSWRGFSPAIKNALTFETHHV
jgi:hypothetical protein